MEFGQYQKKEYNDILNQYPYAKEGPYSSICRYWQYRDYVNKINDLGVKIFDKILIDGRARTFCAYKVHEFMNDSGILFIDDFFRKSYGNKTRGEVDFGESIFSLYTQIDRLDTMIVLKKREIDD